MEPFSTIGVSMGAVGTVSTIATIFYSLRNWIRFKRLRGILLPLGKTTLANRLSSNKVYLVDIDKWIDENLKNLPACANESQRLLQILPTVSAYMKTIVNELAEQKKRVIVISESYELLCALHVKPSKITTYIPDTKLVLDQTIPLKDVDRTALERLKLVIANKVPKYNMYSTFDELANKVMDKFGLKIAL